MAETFAAAGASVAVVARDQTVLEETLAALRDANPDTAHAAISADVRRAGEVARAHAIPHMRDQRWGRIINSLNVGAKAASAQTCPTSASRAAGLAMTKALASEFAPDGVLVNALITGLLVTHQWQTRWEREAHDTAFEEFTAAIGNRIPVGRMGDAQEFANLALFLASDAASYVTGTAINIDGGLTPVV